jgi:ATP-dependent RNA helicase DeaD
VQERSKFDALCRLLDMESPELAIVFGRTKRRVDELSEALQKRGYSADGLHGDLSQNMRDAVMRKFRDGSIDVLVATDVAARGLDVSGVTHVVNFDLPQDPESYVHRIGRTGRAGKEGTSWTFVTPREIDHLHFIEKVTRHRIPKRSLPTIAEAVEGKQKLIAERLLELVENEEYNEFKAVSIQLLENHDSVNLLASAIKLLAGGEKKEVEVELTPEDPIRAKKRKPDIRSSGRRFSGPGGFTKSGGRDSSRPGDRRYGGERRYGEGNRSGSGDGRYGRRDDSRYNDRPSNYSRSGSGSRSSRSGDNNGNDYANI